jgi:hypothetical protein
MILKIKDSILKTQTAQFSFRDYGDFYERKFYNLILDDFPKIEIFWRDFITIMTNRVVSSSTEDVIRARSGVGKEIVDISIIHYSVYMNLVYAKNCLINKQLSYFENFYTHLGSVCDLVEEFVICVYFLQLKCNQKEPEVLTRLSKRKFQDISSNWFDENYSKIYTHYLSKGKYYCCEIVGRSNIVEEYFKGFNEYKEYKRFSLALREYRNVIVHNTQIGTHHIGNDVFIPKMGKIKDYKKWYKVFEVSKEKFQTDFVERDSQMYDSFQSLIKILNNLWDMPIFTMNELLYNEKNKELLEIYQIDFS